MSASQAAHGLTTRPWWPAAKRIVSIAFLLLVGALIINQARAIEWAEVGVSLQRQPLTGLLGAVGLAAASHLLYSTFDLFGRHYTGHQLPVTTVMRITFISYAFNLSLGSLIGGIGLRYRLYARKRLGTAVTTRIVSLSMLTNWLGYFFVGGLVFLIYPPPMPDGWKLGSDALRVMGGVLLLIALCYLAACLFSRRRDWKVRKQTLHLPSGRMALLQLAAASTNWLLIASVVNILLPAHIPYWTALEVLLIGAVAGVITHVPAGLGVLEAVFVALLSDRMPAADILAALLAYRAIYYLVPLAIAAVMHLATEARHTARRAG